MDVRVPFEGTSESVEDADEAWNKVPGFVEGMKKFLNDIRNSLEETVEQSTVFEEEVSQRVINGKDKMSVRASDEFKGHGSGPVVGIFYTTGRTEFGMAPERNKFKSAAVRASIHGTTIRRVTAVDHLFDVFHDNRSWFKVIFNCFIIVG